MNAFEFNKIAGAVLGTAVGVMALGIISDIIFAPPHHQEPGYVIAVAETGEEAIAAAAAPEVEPIALRLQTASVDSGVNVAKKCLACHSFDEGGAAKVGPNLWNIVGGPLAHSDAFNYSEAFREKAAEGETWTYGYLDDYLADPRGVIPGTAMAFAGLNKPTDRADVIAYLRSLSSDPEPLPPPPEAEPETAATDAATSGDEPVAATADTPEATPADGADAAEASAESDATAPADGDQTQPSQADSSDPTSGESMTTPAADAPAATTAGDQAEATDDSPDGADAPATAMPEQPPEDGASAVDAGPAVDEAPPENAE